MRKVGGEFKCSRCEKELKELADKGIALPKAEESMPMHLTMMDNGDIKVQKGNGKVEVVPAQKDEQKDKIAEVMKGDPSKDKSEEIRSKINMNEFFGGMGVADVKNENWLGFFLGYSIGDRLIPHEEADSRMHGLHMPNDIRPKKSRPRDAFKNACANQEKDELFQSQVFAKKHDLDPKTKFRAVYKADQTRADEYVIDRKIYIVEKSEEGKESATKKKSDIQFDRLARITLVVDNEGKKDEAYRIVAEPMEDGNKKSADYLKTVIESDWKLFQKSYTSKQIRDALRQYIVKRQGIPFTTGKGGMWFIPKVEEQNIIRWKEFLSWCDKQREHGSGNRVNLSILPAVDLYGIKTDIARDVADEVRQRVKGIIEDAYASLKGEKSETKIEEILAKKLAEKKDDVDGLLETYKQILKEDIAVELELDTIRSEQIEEHLSEKAKALMAELRSV
jgi:hypothetical protein